MNTFKAHTNNNLHSAHKQLQLNRIRFEFNEVIILQLKHMLNLCYPDHDFGKMIKIISHLTKAKKWILSVLK